MLNFHNPTLLPIEAATITGVSVKEGENAIGKFGTGLKYAIAGVLRLDGQISILTGGSTFTFTSHPTQIRGQTFHVVHCNGERCGFTTDLGKHWEPWMILRELYSNMKDEGGDWALHPTEALTQIHITCPALEAAWERRDEFLLSTQPLWSNERLEVHPRTTSNIYYQGIKVGEAPNALFTYNIRSQLTLTEDRTLRSIYEVSGILGQELISCDDETIFRPILTDVEGTSFEAQFISFPAYYNRAEPFEEFLRARYQGRMGGLSEKARSLARAIFGDLEIETRDLTPAEATKLERAQAFLRRYSIPIHPVHVPSSALSDAYGFVKGEKIYITGRAFREGTEQLAMTLIEETIHLDEQETDFTRGFQDALLRLIIQVHETATGETI